MNRSVLLLIAAAIGVLTSFTTAVDLVPRVRLVDVVLVFFGAFGAGAAFTAAVVELKTKRESRPNVRGRPLAVFLLIAVLSASAEAQTAPTAAPPDLDAYVARTMQTFSVPGTSLSVVKDGRVVVAKGYGVRKLGEPAAVDAQTLFGIASNTKIVTAAALGLLVEEGKLEWDAPVIRYLPWFQMWDPYVTRELSIRDLLVHRSGLGLGAGDLLWWPASTYDRKEIARRLRFIRPVTSFRSAYAYDNVLYLVAGEVIESLSGKSWEDFVTERILKRVGGTPSARVLRGTAPPGRPSCPRRRPRPPRLRTVGPRPPWRRSGRLRPRNARGRAPLACGSGPRSRRSRFAPLLRRPRRARSGSGRPPY